jgi:hypothetical protein
MAYPRDQWCNYPLNIFKIRKKKILMVGNDWIV